MKSLKFYLISTIFTIPLLLFFIPKTQEFTVIAKSSLETCINNDTNNETMTNCKEKIVLTLSIENAELADADKIF